MFIKKIRLEMWDENLIIVELTIVTIVRTIIVTIIVTIKCEKTRT